MDVRRTAWSLPRMIMVFQGAVPGRATAQLATSFHRLRATKRRTFDVAEVSGSTHLLPDPFGQFRWLAHGLSKTTYARSERADRERCVVHRLHEFYLDEPHSALQLAKGYGAIDKHPERRRET